MSTLTKNSHSEIAYLGPEGSFSYIVAKNRYPDGNLRPFGSIDEVFEYLSINTEGKGIVPIENSSAGFIPNTVDGLIDNKDILAIEEVLSIDVKLALLGKKHAKVKTVYSHFAPFHLCRDYIRKNYPDADKIICDSTSAAAKAASEAGNAVAIAPKTSAEAYGLDVIDYPIEQSIENVTQFFVLTRGERNKAGNKTSLIIALPNEPGKLVDFLKPFGEAKINLTRLLSRPIPGKPNLHRFLVELEGAEDDSLVAAVLEKASQVCTEFINVGSYPAIKHYSS